eukprot:6647471-Pyramimonas_sp.AAC.1
MLPAVQDAVGSAQCAAIPGRGFPMAISSARALQRLAIARTMCIGFLFVDVANAFYMALRELVMDTDTSWDSFRDLPALAGLPEADLPLLELSRACPPTGGAWAKHQTYSYISLTKDPTICRCE